ncbi:Beta-1,4 N-acetylgalactosaminyltransferase 1 [Clydaea vesicula]|uniref:Beta-1,4 N-acetylgalactosaminyltransferase 1 n=1 Tax=Clydaea vesicula TaxID=447962 RepID=A0AAD5U1I5_9FUNG|nr:Beta-1,4 N-acetylgalactosaminyltransferase 1 [Clydaea vesicula]
MLWTTKASTFKYRNYKTLESYFYHHPDAEIILYVTDLKTSDFDIYTNNGYDIKLVNLTDDYLRQMSLDCPGKSWIDNLSEHKKGKYYYSHITDYVRFCALYQWGGLYSDFDAITLQRLDVDVNFIGRDSANSGGTCTWCAWKNDIYLPPGVMAAEKGHPILKKALEIGFGADYDSNIFNQVGPMAITKAYNEITKESGVDESFKIYAQEELYPYNYLTSSSVFYNTQASFGKLERIRRSAKSLHLFGHKTKNLEIEHHSILMRAFEFYSIINDRLVEKEFKLKGPRQLSVGKVLEELEDIRIVSPKEFKRDPSLKFFVKVKVANGYIRLATTNQKEIKNKNKKLESELEDGWKKDLVMEDFTISSLNKKLSRLIYYSKNLPNGRDEITVILKTNKGKLEQRMKIPVYDVTALVTIIVKTVGRLDKVVSLAESTRKFYQTAVIIVADDIEFNKRPEGMSREYYYLPLPADIGLSAGRNKMIEKVKTEYFLTLDDDFTMDRTSQLGILIHALEIAGKDGKKFDIAAGKNPVDESKYGFDFCGLLHVENKTLFLKNGYLSSTYHENCMQVEFVPNIFLGRTETFKNRIKWDELLKVGEHEDFFLRAKEIGIKTLTCPGVAFQHNQVEHWLKRDDYEIKRSRVFDFWKLSLRKHGLEKLNSFGKIMMDLVEPPPVNNVEIISVFSQSMTLTWDSSSPSFKILYTESGKDDWKPVNDGEGEDYRGGKSIVVSKLKSGTQYLFNVFAGNNFDFENQGFKIAGVTMKSKVEESLNLIENGSFEKLIPTFKVSMGGIFHVQNFEANTGNFSGRTQILTRAFNSKFPTTVFISQLIDYQKICKKKKNSCFNSIKKNERNLKTRTLNLSANSKSERLYGWVEWRVELFIKFKGEDKSIMAKEDFDRLTNGWQTRVISMCLNPLAEIETIEVKGVLITFPGSVFWDDFVLIESF